MRACIVLYMLCAARPFRHTRLPGTSVEVRQRLADEVVRLQARRLCDELLRLALRGHVRGGEPSLDGINDCCRTCLLVLSMADGKATTCGVSQCSQWASATDAQHDLHALMCLFTLRMPSQLSSHARQA